MKIAAGHELKHKAAMSKAGEVEVGIPIPITPETLRIRRGASVNSSKAQADGVIFCMHKAYRLVTSRAFVDYDCCQGNCRAHVRSTYVRLQLTPHTLAY